MGEVMEYAISLSTYDGETKQLYLKAQIWLVVVSKATATICILKLFFEN